MSVDKIHLEVKIKPITAIVDSNMPKTISWLIERKPILPASCRSGLFRSRSQDLTTHVIRAARDRPRTAGSLPESSFPSDVYMLEENHRCHKDTIYDGAIARIEQLERENIELRSLIERLMAETEAQRSTYGKQLEVISQLKNENECLREQREILMAPVASYHTRQRIVDFLGSELDTIVEDQTWNIINYRIMFIEMRKLKRNRVKQRPSVKRYFM